MTGNQQPPMSRPDVELAYEELRARHVGRFHQLLPELEQRLAWDDADLKRFQTEGLRRLIGVARQRSPWHRDRLAGIEIGDLTVDDLADLPVMTKADLMANFDDIVTDPRLTREVCEQHLESLSADRYLLEEFHVVASGGSSGQRGVYVYGWDGWATCYSSIVRFSGRERAANPRLEGVRPVMAMVAAAKATHISSAINQTFSNPDLQRRMFPVTLPLEDIVAGLNELQPNMLAGYSSYLGRLAAEARAGRLHISPLRVTGISEPLLPETRALLEVTWGAPVSTGYGMSEGLFVSYCGHGIHLPDDLCLLEAVGADGAELPAGVTSDRCYVTNLYNTVLPLIRFEVTDQVTVLPRPCPCGSIFRRVADPQGRLDETFVYPGGIEVHPHMFRSLLGEEHIIEYQVRQTAAGADIDVVTTDAFDASTVSGRIEAALRRLGLNTPEVRVAEVAELRRQATGKLKRFIPLGGGTQV